MSVVAVIPARYASTRFPAKALAAATGKYLVQHVYEQARQAGWIDRVVIATDDERIATAVKSFDGEYVMTRADHVSGTDRVGEAAELLRLGDDDLVLNVQGDEAEISPESLDALVGRMLHGRDEGTKGRRDVGNDYPPGPAGAGPSPLGKGGGERERSDESTKRRSDEGGLGEESKSRKVKSVISQGAMIGTIAAAFDDAGPKAGPGSPADPNCVKVVVDGAGRALYFSRSLIPYPRDTGGAVDRPSRWLLHMGVYAFRVAALRRVTGGRMDPTALERSESLEQLRWLQNGLDIDVVIVKERSVGIDTPEDYAAFLKRHGEAKETAQGLRA